MLAPLSALVLSVIYGFIVRPVILVKEVRGYTYRSIYACILKCLEVTLCSAVIPSALYLLVTDNDTIGGNLIVISASVVSVAFFSLLFMPVRERSVLIDFIFRKIHRKEE